MTMHRPHHLVGIRHALDQLAHCFRILEGDGIADRIWHVDGPGPRLDHRLEDTAQKIDFRTPGILRGKLDVVRKLPRPTNGLDGLLDDLVGRHAQLLLHMDGRSGNKGVDTPGFGRPDRLASPIDVVLVGSRQGTDGRILDGLGDGMNGIEIALRSRSKACLDHIDPHLFQLASDANLLFPGH